MQQIHKYPRTRHIEGSRLQPGDEDLDAVKFSKLAGRHLVVEEKVDGANCGISFATNGELQLQSRGHFLTGGPREKHFALFKQWANSHAAALRDRLDDRYVIYGEWLFAKHTIFYDALPHYLMEFDVLDTANGEFLSTPRRAELLDGLPIVSVRVLYEGEFKNKKDLTLLIGASEFIRPGHLVRLRHETERLGFDADKILRETDRSTEMEGLYIKVEEDGVVTERYKYIRPDFLTAVLAADGHWLNRPIVPNLLVDGVDLFEVV
jgi:hypothetical protein